MIRNGVSTDRALLPTDITEWLRGRGWSQTASLGDIAQRWQNDTTGVLVPMLTTSPDFSIRWSEMLSRLADELNTDSSGVLMAVEKSGSDVAEFRASGQIDDSLPLSDAATLIDSIRRAVQACANSALQPRSYYGHSLPDAARDHARNVRMGRTRSGSYVVPIISRLPILQPEDADDAVLFEDVTYQPFARSAMLKLAQGLMALRDLTHATATPTGGRITASVGAGVSTELCEAVARSLETESVAALEVNFSWADRLPASTAPRVVQLDSESVPLMRHVASVLKGVPVVGQQTMIGYVKRLDRGEEDEIGRITLRVLDSDKARNVTMDLNDSDYHVAGEANTERRMVAATGTLYREPGRALRLAEVAHFQLIDDLPGLVNDDSDE